MGWGGVLETAQFLPTLAMDTRTLCAKIVSTPDAIARCKTPGLLVDARGAEGAALIKSVMESTKLTKLIWGADGDCASLYHQKQIGLENVIDVQLGFSTPQKRLGMARALDSVPPAFVAGLPDKVTNPDKYLPSAYNRRCNDLPCGRDEELYAMDDLHRIEAIISTKKTASFERAKKWTQQFIDDLPNPRSGLGWLRNESFFYNRKFGMMKSQKAVQLARACVHIELTFASKLSDADKRLISEVRSKVGPELARKGVAMPSDLSFAGDSNGEAALPID